MIDYLGNWLRNIAFFIIFTVFLEMLMPDGSFRKYIRMLLSLILILILTRPVGSFLLEASSVADRTIINELEFERQSILKETIVFQEKQDDLIIETYKEKLEMQIIKLIESNSHYSPQVIEIQINEDRSSQNFGAIEAIKILLTEKEDHNARDNTIGVVKPIHINTSIKNENKTENSNINPEIEKI